MKDFSDRAPSGRCSSEVTQAPSALSKVKLPCDAVTRGEVLRAANLATLTYAPASDMAMKLQEFLTDQLIDHEREAGTRRRQRTQAALKSLGATISALFADLVLASGNVEALGFCYRPMDKDEIAETLASVRQIDAVISAWKALGLIETVKGVQGFDDFDGDQMLGKGWATRLRATPPLIEVAQAHGISSDNIGEHYTRELGGTYPIVLRATKTKSDSRGRRMKVTRTDRVERMADDVRYINETIAKADINLAEVPQFRRIFNDGDMTGFDWDRGGRLYASGGENFQNKEAKRRSRITIDGHPTVELDIRASQLTIAYALLGMSLNWKQDPYEIEGLPRIVVKVLVTAYLGKGSRPRRWPSKYADEYKEWHRKSVNLRFPLGKSLDIIEARHPLLKRLAENGIDAPYLQYVESEIIMKAMLRLIDQYRIVTLPVFDCLIVQDGEAAEDAEVVLAEEFFNRTGAMPMVVRK